MSVSHIRIAVLRGGPSAEYETSLASGAFVLKHLPEKYTVLDVLIDKNGLWHIAGVPRDPGRVLGQVDLVWNALHGAYGEDGEVQRTLLAYGIPFTGSHAAASARAFHKPRAKEIFIEAGLQTPVGIVVSLDTPVEKVIRIMHDMSAPPYIIKPVSGGSSLGVAVIKNFAEAGDIWKSLYNEQPEGMVLIEEKILGTEATCGVINGFRGENLYALPPIEIRYDTDFHVPGKAWEISPGRFSESHKRELERASRLAHEALGLRHYSRSDFMVHPRRGVFILETNSLPGLTSESLFPKALASVGATPSQFLEHVIGLAKS